MATSSRRCSISCSRSPSIPVLFVARDDEHAVDRAVYAELWFAHAGDRRPEVLHVSRTPGIVVDDPMNEGGTGHLRRVLAGRASSDDRCTRRGAARVTRRAGRA
jgi:hypothetical protein